MRYYGGKTKLIDFIEMAVKNLDLYDGAKFLDIFTGTTAVAKHFKKLGYTVIANDNLEFCYALAKTYIELNDNPRFTSLQRIVKDSEGAEPHEKVVNYLNGLEPIEGVIYRHYCPGGTKNLRTYFTDINGKKIDIIRTQIEEWKKEERISEIEFYYLITALIEAVNLVSNVAGTYAACLKTWDKRALGSVYLRPPEVIKSNRINRALKMDANEVVSKISTDVLYLDPPYNTRQFITNYFMLELIAEGWFDKNIQPNTKTGLFFDESKKSLYSKKSTAPKALAELVDKARARHILLSYSNEGIISEDSIKKTLAAKGELVCYERTHRRYRSINQDGNDPNLVNERLYSVTSSGLKQRFNQLNGATWLKQSFSIWRDITKNSEEISLHHPAIFPISLAERLIEIFTDTKDAVVLDPFVGSGSTVIAALRQGRKAIGVDLNPEFINICKQRLLSHYRENNEKDRYKLIIGDALEIEQFVTTKSIKLCITSPPYWDILNEKRTADNKTNVNYSDRKNDLGNIRDYSEFLSTLKNVFGKVRETLQDDGFCAVIVMDLRKKSRFYPFHADLISSLSAIGLRLRDIIIWDRQKEYNNLKPLGYPYSFIVNKIHEYILIFEKVSG